MFNLNHEHAVARRRQTLLRTPRTPGMHNSEKMMRRETPLMDRHFLSLYRALRPQESPIWWFKPTIVPPTLAIFHTADRS